MDRFRTLSAFVQIVERGTFARAAEALDTSAAQITRQVAALEAHLGTRLLHRNARRVALTDTGQAYYERAKRILEDLDEADALAGHAAAVPAGVLHINTPVTFGTLHLAPLWPKFRAAYPRIELDVTLTDRLVDLIEEGVDVAVRIARLQSSSLVARKLATARMVVCASPAYLAQHGAPRTPDDLMHHRCLGYRYAMTRDEWSFTHADGRSARVTVQCDFHANNGELIHMACLAGEGIALQPTFIAGPAIAQGALVALLLDWPAPALGIYAVYATRRQLSARVRALVDFLAHEIHDPPPWDAWASAASGQAR